MPIAGLLGGRARGRNNLLEGQLALQEWWFLREMRRLGCCIDVTSGQGNESVAVAAARRKCGDAQSVTMTAGARNNYTTHTQLHNQQHHHQCLLSPHLLCQQAQRISARHSAGGCRDTRGCMRRRPTQLNKTCHQLSGSHPCTVLCIRILAVHSHPCQLFCQPQSETTLLTHRA